MPWYWTDEVARHLMTQGRIDAERAEAISRQPVAIRRPEPDLEAAASAMLDDGEIPLAA